MNAECTNCAKFHRTKKMPSVLVIPEGHSAESIASLLIDVMERKADEAEIESDRACLLRAKEILLASVAEKRSKYRRTVCGQFPALSKCSVPMSPKTRDAVPAMKMPSSPKDSNLHADSADEASKTQHERGKSCKPANDESESLAVDSHDIVNDADLSLHSYGLKVLEAVGLGRYKTDSQDTLRKHPSKSISETVCDKKRPAESVDGGFRPVKRSRSETEGSESTVGEESKLGQTSSCDTEQTKQSPVDSGAQKGCSPGSESDSKNLNFHGYTLLKSKKDMPRDIPLERTSSDLGSDPRLKTMMFQKVKRLATVARSLVMANVFRKLGLVKPLLSRNITVEEKSSSDSHGPNEVVARICAAALLTSDSGNSPSETVPPECIDEPPPILNSENLPAGKVEETVASCTEVKANQLDNVEAERDAAIEQCEATYEYTSPTPADLETRKSGPVESDGTLVSCHEDHIGVLPMNLEQASDNESDSTLKWNTWTYEQPMMTVHGYPNLIVSNEPPVWGYAQWQQSWNTCSMMPTNGYQHSCNYYPTRLPPQPWTNMQTSTTDSTSHISWQNYSSD